MKDNVDVRLVAATAMALIGLSLDSAAAINGWTALGPAGGSVDKIAYSLDGKTAFMTAAGGYYRSQDSGVSWQLIKSNFPNVPPDVAIDPSDPNRIYLVAQNAPCLYVSTDGGLTLVASIALPGAIQQASHIAVSQDGTTLYLNSYGRIFYSTDRGQTWLEGAALSADSTASVTKLLIDPSDSKTLYAAVAIATTASEGIFATHDGAQTWQQVTSGTEGASLTSDLAINSANPAQIWSAQYDGVWVSADRGIHWSNAFSTAAMAVAIDPTNPAIIYAGTPFGKIYRTADAGVNWTEISGSSLAGENPHIAVNPTQPNQLLVGGFAGVTGSTTSGATWVSQQTGFNGPRVSGFSADITADRIYLQLPNNGIFYTAGGGTAVRSINNAALLQLSTQPAIAVTTILAQSGRLFASLNTGLTSSSDGGTTWTPVVLPVPGTAGTEQLFAMTSTLAAPQSILAASNGSIVKPADGGATWYLAAGLPGSISVSSSNGLLFAPSDPSIAYAGIYSNTAGAVGVFKSTDSGDVWGPVNQNPSGSPSTLLAVDPSNANILYGSGAAGLLKSIDGGTTWSTLTWDVTVPGNAPFVLAVDPVHTSVLYAGDLKRIGRSVDGGASWETLRAYTGAAALWIPDALIADPNRPENLLLGTDANGAQQITIAPDLTLAATSQPSPLAIGATATYTYSTTNQGPFDATGVKVTVQLPPSAKNISAAASGGNCTVTGLAANCIFPIVRKGATSNMTVTAVTSTAGAFQVSALVAGDQPDSDASDNAVSSNLTAKTVSDMSVTASGNASAHVGDAVTYTLVATNQGPSVEPDAQLAFQLGAGLTFVTVSSTNATCNSDSSGQITCTLSDLAVGKAVTVTIHATASTVGAQTSTATVTSGATDLVSANNSASATTTVSEAVPPPAAAPGGGGGGGLSLYEILALASLLGWTQYRRASRWVT